MVRRGYGSWPAGLSVILLSPNSSPFASSNMPPVEVSRISRDAVNGRDECWPRSA